MKQLWDRISYLGLSHIPKEEAVYQNRETLLINRITAVLAAVVVVYIPIEIIFNGLDLVYIILTQLTLFSLVLLWNYKGYFEFAKYYFLFLILLIICTMPIVAPPEARNEYFAVPASIAGVLFFKEKWKAFLFMVITLVSFYYIAHLRKSIPPMIEMEQELLLFFSQIFIAMVFLMNFIVVIYFRLTNEDYEKIIHNQRDTLKKTNELVSEKNKEITDSINYAKRIQSAYLPREDVFYRLFGDAFLLYLPKDIVSGDFYWFLKTSSEESQDKKEILFAAADCTGHGVPGALMSVICCNAINEAVITQKITVPGKALDEVRKIVQRALKSDLNNDQKDGMDISLVSLSEARSEGNVSLSEVKDKGGNPRSHTHSRTLKWAGANNPLWIIRKGATEVEEIKPNKQPIGKVDNPQPFTTHTIELHQGDTIYIFTDGYQDQFGGEKGKKFKASKLKELLLSIQHETMPRQKEIIKTAFEDWKGELEQVDDVCVIGVRL